MKVHKTNSIIELRRKSGNCQIYIHAYVSKFHTTHGILFKPINSTKVLSFEDIPLEVEEIIVSHTS